MCSGSDAGSYSRLIDFVYHSTLGLRVIKKKRRNNLKGFDAFHLQVMPIHYVCGCLICAAFARQRRQ